MGQRKNASVNGGTVPARPRARIMFVTCSVATSTKPSEAIIPAKLVSPARPGRSDMERNLGLSAWRSHAVRGKVGRQAVDALHVLQTPVFSLHVCREMNVRSSSELSRKERRICLAGSSDYREYPTRLGNGKSLIKCIRSRTSREPHARCFCRSPQRCTAETSARPVDAGRDTSRRCRGARNARPRGGHDVRDHQLARTGQERGARRHAGSGLCARGVRLRLRPDQRQGLGSPGRSRRGSGRRLAACARRAAAYPAR